MNHISRPALATRDCSKEAHSGMIMIMILLYYFNNVFCSVYLRMELELLTRNQEEKSLPH